MLIRASDINKLLNIVLFILQGQRKSLVYEKLFIPISSRCYTRADMDKTVRLSLLLSLSHTHTHIYILSNIKPHFPHHPDLRISFCLRSIYLPYPLRSIQAANASKFLLLSMVGFIFQVKNCHNRSTLTMT